MLLLAEALVMERDMRLDQVNKLTDALMTTSLTLAMERDERVWLKNQVEKLAEVVTMERDRRLELQNQVEQQDVSILELKNIVHEMKSKIEELS
jgi:hypothetical protein